MADVNRMVRRLQAYLPSLAEMMMRQQINKEEVLRWLDKSLKETAAYGEEQRKTIDATTKAEIMKALSDPRFFTDKTAGAQALMSWLNKTMPGMMPQVNVPPDIDAQVAAAQDALSGMSKYALAGEQPPTEILSAAGKFIDPKQLQQLVDDIITKQEGGAERGVRTKAIEAQLADTDVRKGELRAREKELEAETGKGKGKTQKELMSDLDKLKDERDKEAQKLVGISTGTRTGMVTGEQKQSVLAKIAKIDRDIAGLDKILGTKTLPTKEENEEFVKRAQAAIAAGKKVNWQEAIMQGADPAWILMLRERLEVKKR